MFETLIYIFFAFLMISAGMIETLIFITIAFFASSVGISGFIMNDKRVVLQDVLYMTLAITGLFFWSVALVPILFG